ncbi:hypothetical protein [Streptomyces sp. ISL-11]|uniref:hypothetical protein n=1 Tax=Streptomyces sp. ISL-11 TaxID=2819174 RepID=UPI001BEBBF7C|nr:hypothetical protein [Streptomyces sp. ISL-11]MBT2387332.1 hypothetical protein [Streptomyces sp. ISL-11]
MSIALALGTITLASPAHAAARDGAFIILENPIQLLDTLASQALTNVPILSSGAVVVD